MRYFSAVCCMLLFACRVESHAGRVDSAAAVVAFRDSLERFGAQDQVGRDSIGIAVVRQDTMFLKRIAREDSTRTRWLQAAVAANGWPRRSVVGERAATAAWLIVQHSADAEFQAQMLPVLEQAAASSEVRAADVAMLADRIAVHRGQPQRYGTQFSLHDGILTADPIANLPALDSLRATVGLPPMREYVKVLAEMNKLRVEWPPR